MLVLEGFVPLCIRSGLWRRWWLILLSNGPQRPSMLRSNHHHRPAFLNAGLWLLFRTKAPKVIRQACCCATLPRIWGRPSCADNWQSQQKPRPHCGQSPNTTASPQLDRRGTAPAQKIAGNRNSHGRIRLARLILRPALAPLAGNSTLSRNWFEK